MVEVNNRSIITVANDASITEHRELKENLTLDKKIYKTHIPHGADASRRERVLMNWYRKELKARIPPLIKKWEAVLGVQVADLGVKRMKTKWGSCNIEARRIWLNLELAKKPVQCLEYIVVHEMVHLIERSHNDDF